MPVSNLLLRQREAVQSLDKLKSALISKNASSINTVCQEMKTKYALADQCKNVDTMGFAERLCNDKFSQSLVPKDVPCNLTAKKSRGNGSCFYNSLSLALTGNEHQSEQLRILIAIELFENAEWYCDVITSAVDACEETGLSKNALFLMVTSCDGIKPDSDRRGIIEDVAVKTCDLYEWASLIHFHAAASVIQQQVFSVYPQRDHLLGKTRSLYHRLIHPRSQNDDKRSIPVYIMWSSFSSTGRHGFSPNHFVPLFPCLKEFKYEAEFPPLSKKPNFKRPRRTQKSDFSKKDDRNLIRAKTTTASQCQPSSLRFPHLSCHWYEDNGRDNGKAAVSKPQTSSLPFPHLSCNRYEEKGRDTETTTAFQCQPSSLPFPHLSCSWYEDKGRDTVTTTVTQPQSSSLPFPKLSCNRYEEKGRDTETTTAFQCQPSSLPFPHLSCSWYEDKGRDTVTTTVTQRQSSSLPFPNLSCNWYKDKGINHNTFQPQLLASSVQLKSKCAIPVSCRSFRKASETWYAKNCDQNFVTGIDDQKEFISSLPFQHASKHWYKNRGKLFTKNQSRYQKKQQTAAGKKCLEESVAELEAKLIEEELSQVVRKDYVAVIEAGNYLIANGPLVAANEISKVYREKRQSTGKRGLRPSELIRKLKKHFNICHVAISGKIYMLENKYPNIQTLAKNIEDSLESNKKKTVNNQIRNSVGHLFNSALAFADTKKDRDIIMALFTKATSVRLVADLMNTKNKNAIMACRDEFEGNLASFEELRKTSQVVRNDMTCEQQRRLMLRIVNKRKQNLLRLPFETRGRNLKSDVFPQLGIVLENIFQAGDAGTGGLECHPRLTTDLQYRSKDNNFFMRQAREVLLSVAPPNFSIALSTCFNYTESYKDGTHSAKRHHSGKNINARVSLKPPPRIGAFKNVINLHWSTKNVNLLLEDSENGAEDHMIDSRDAKSMICGDIPPVQLPGKSWRAITYPDHTFEQGKTNAVYPKTHLFMDTSKYKSILETENSDWVDVSEKRTVTRTGQAVMLVSLSFFEPETTFRGMNEIFHMLTFPELDGFFRNPSNKKLKSIFSFIVDNGHSEDPDSPLTQMCLVRILRLLGLSRISQRSFAEYHSKRNFAERPHAAANEVLSRHGAFNSRLIHSNAITGSSEHRENMEEMAKNVQQCLCQAKFGGHFINAIRGVTEKDQIFNDEHELKQFLALSEERKSACTWTYKAVENQAFETLVSCWGVPETFQGSYAEDYEIISGQRTWKDDYSTTIFGNEIADNKCVPVLEQPVPDYLRWFQTQGELHYLSYEKTAAIIAKKEINLRAGEFLPTRVLSLFFQLHSDPPDSVLENLALLCFVPFNDVKKHFSEEKEKMEKDYENDIRRERWKKHYLYAKRVKDLETLCIENGIVYKGLQKHDLVEKLSAKLDKHPPPEYKPAYDGKIQAIPCDITDIKKLSVSLLKFILRSHAITFKASKDELVLRVFLLRHSRLHFAFKSLVKELELTIYHAKQVTYAEIGNDILKVGEIHRERAYSTTKIKKSQIPVSCKINDVKDLPKVMFTEIENFIDVLRKPDKNINLLNTESTRELQDHVENDPILPFYEIGQLVKVKWSADDIGDSGWRPGWYIAEVQGVDQKADLIRVVYSSEPECVYDIDVTPFFIEGKLRLWDRQKQKIKAVL